MELLTIEELRERMVCAPDKTVEDKDDQECGITVRIEDALSPLAKEAKDNLIDLLYALPEFSAEEKELIVNAFLEALRLVAEDCIQYGVDLGQNIDSEVDKH